MIYRKKNLDFFNIQLNKVINKTLSKKLKQSFKRNYYQAYNKRLAFFLQNFYTNKHKNFYFSQNKIICFITFSSKVSNSKLLLSRFFLTKHVDKLLLGGIQK